MVCNRFVLTLTAVAALACAACNSSGSKGALPPDSCGTQPPNAFPAVGLAFPANGSTGVATSLSEVIFQGSSSDWAGPLEMQLNAKNLLGSALGPAAAPPSPLPSPLELHPHLPNQYFAMPVALQPLVPNTTYQVFMDTLEWSSTFVDPEAPHCTAEVTATLGYFRTGSSSAVRRPQR